MTGTLATVAKRLAEQHIRPYVARLSKSQLIPLSPKEINDPIWGTISLNPLEVAVLDSPLLQRLRHLKQLGVAHWLYPGTTHSRFEHSLGVLHQTEQLITAINRSSPRYGETIISADQRDAIRLAGLLHDTGHPVLSHVSEYALTTTPEIQLEITRSRRSQGADIKISEFIAAQLVQTQDFKDLISLVLTAQARAGLPTSAWLANIDSLTTEISNCILGIGISDKVPLLHQIISGPYDADKLDYMVRDARMAGIPSTIDISRLLQKITVRSLQQAELPSSIAKNVKSAQSRYYLFGFPWSGLSVVDELLLARIILYAKVYRHPKVAAAEAVVKALVRQLTRLTSIPTVIDFVYDVLDDELILADAELLQKRLRLTPRDLEDENKANALKISAHLVACLRERDLFVRGFVFYSHDQKKSTDDNDHYPFATIVKVLQNKDATEALRFEIVEETRKIMSLLVSEYEDQETYKRLDATIVITKVDQASQEELRHTYIFPSADAPKTYGAIKMNKDAWSNSFTSGAAKGFVFCPREVARFVFVATEVVLARRIGVAVPQWMLEEAKQTKQDVDEIKNKLRASDYYDDKPPAVRPLSEYLQNAYSSNVVKKFAEKFAAIQAMDTAASDVDAIEAAESRTYAWLDQFESEEHINCALALLERSRLHGRSETVEAFKRFLELHPNFARASIVPLGEGGESAQIIQYYFRDVPGEYKLFASLKDAVAANRDEPVLFIDDFCASGGQVKGILKAWTGRDDVVAPELHEQRTLALEPERDFINNRPLALLFVAAWAEGLKEVERYATQELGLNLKAYGHFLDDSLPQAFSHVPHGVALEVWESFKAKCEVIGYELLSSEKDWPQEIRKGRVLGYGNKALLLYFPYNCPAQTLTCIWATGTTGGKPWINLVSRRKKEL